MAAQMDRFSPIFQKKTIIFFLFVLQLMWKYHSYFWNNDVFLPSHLCEWLQNRAKTLWRSRMKRTKMSKTTQIISFKAKSLIEVYNKYWQGFFLWDPLRVNHNQAYLDHYLLLLLAMNDLIIKLNVKRVHKDWYTAHNVTWTEILITWKSFKHFFNIILNIRIKCLLKKVKFIL